MKEERRIYKIVPVNDYDEHANESCHTRDDAEAADQSAQKDVFVEEDFAAVDADDRERVDHNIYAQVGQCQIEDELKSGASS